jgi:acyl carrier protein/Asp-tRNA(Asn)/Glu-tRNA(Gln) amidotransferase C subunit
MEKYLVAYFVPADTVTGTDEEKPGVEVADLREYLFARVPIYMLPSYFVQLDSIPLTSNGKPDRRALPLPTVKMAGEYVPPGDTVETHLVEIWAKLLLLEEEKIGINANFFELGGHSLNAMTLVSRIHEELGTKIPLAIVFDMPTIRELAEYIKNTQGEKSVRIEPAEKKEYYVMSSAQKRMYIFQQLDAADTTYNMFQVLTINRKVDRNKLTEVFQRLVNRHEILRTSAELINEEPVQRVHEHVPFQVEYYSLGNGNREAEEQIVKDFVRPFQLDAVPLMRVGLIKREEEQYVLMVDIPEYTKKQETYWLNRFKGDIPYVNILADHPRPPGRRIEARMIEFVIENEWYERLDKLAFQKGATLFMVLVAVVNILIAKHTEEEDIIMGLPIEGRHQAELQDVLGMFVNMLALRNFPQPYKTFEMFLAEVRKNLLDAYENQDYQFEELVTKLKIKRDLSRNPLFDFVFVMNNVEPIQPVTSAAPVTPASGQDDMMIAPYAYDHSTARFDLTLYVQPTANHLDCALRYSTALFKRETIERVIENLHEILHQVVENPGIKLEDIQISTHLIKVDDFTREDEVDFNF